MSFYFNEFDILTNSRVFTQASEIKTKRDYFLLKEMAFEREVPGSSQFMTNASGQPALEYWREVDAAVPQGVGASVDPLFRGLMNFTVPINIGKEVKFTAAGGGMDSLVISISGEAPVPVDEAAFDYVGDPIPVFAQGFGLPWRKRAAMEAEGVAAVADNQRAALSSVTKGVTNYFANGKPGLRVRGVPSQGLFNHARASTINLGSGTGAVVSGGIDLTSATREELIEFFTGTMRAEAIKRGITAPLAFYVSSEIGARMALPTDAAWATTGGTVRQLPVMEAIGAAANVASIDVTNTISGNNFIAFVPDLDYVEVPQGMALTTEPIARLRPFDPYHFVAYTVLGVHVKLDVNGNPGVFRTISV